MIFLDTDIISFYIKGVPEIYDKINEAFDSNDTLCTTLINKYEIIKGFRWKENKRKEIHYTNFMNHLMILPINETVINIAANIYANLRRSGKVIGDLDILIAAIVIANNGTLVTNNIKHFENIEQLKVVNWA